MTTEVAVRKKKKKVAKKPLAVEASKHDKIMAELKGFQIEILESGTEDLAHDYLPFQNLAMNIISGGGAIENKFIEISGDSQTGKSYLAYELMACVINNGGHAYLNDNELAYEKAYGDRSGFLAGKKYAKSKEKDIQSVFREMRAWIKATRKFDRKNKIICVIDSYVGLSTKVDIANEEAQKDPRGFMAMQKNMAWQNAIGNFINYLDKYNVTLVLVNQAKLDKINSKPNYKIYNSLGEDVIKFWCTQRIRLLAKSKIKKLTRKDGKKKFYKVVGQEVLVECIKNRTTAPFQKTTIQILFERGIVKYSGLEEIFLSDGIIAVGTKTVDDEKVKGFKLLSTGKFYKNIRTMVEENPEIASPSNHFSINRLDDVEPEELEVDNGDDEDDSED